MKGQRVMKFIVRKIPKEPPEGYLSWLEWWKRRTKSSDRQTCQVVGCTKEATIGVSGNDPVGYTSITGMCKEHAEMKDHELDIIPGARIINSTTL